MNRNCFDKGNTIAKVVVRNLRLRTPIFNYLPLAFSSLKLWVQIQSINMNFLKRLLMLAKELIVLRLLIATIFNRWAWLFQMWRRRASVQGMSKCFKFRRRAWRMFQLRKRRAHVKKLPWTKTWTLIFYTSFYYLGRLKVFVV